jgi:hypothetical protein
MLKHLLQAPPVNISPNKGFLSQIMAWFTTDHIAAIIVLVICVAFVMTLWKMIKGHPIVLLVIVIIALVAAGVLTFKHPNGQAPQPIIPLPKGH